MDTSYPNYNLRERFLIMIFYHAFVDHLIADFTFLGKFKLPTGFFNPTKCTLDHQVLDVNKIHFILSSISDKKCLVNDI
jgi:hypothetical protein